MVVFAIGTEWELLVRMDMNDDYVEEKYFTHNIMNV